MSSAPLSIAVVLGSARYGRRCDSIARWVSDTLRADSGVSVDAIDPQELSLSFIYEPLSDDNWPSLERQLDSADAFVIVTPEYHHGYTAVLKLIIDAVPDVWQTKPIGFVSYGAHSGGLRAVEQLKQVFVSLQAMPINRAVSLPYIERYFAQGQKQGADFSPGVSDRRHLDTLIDELDMWARRLQAVRAEPSASDLMAWTG